APPGSPGDPPMVARPTMLPKSHFRPEAEILKACVPASARADNWTVGQLSWTVTVTYFAWRNSRPTLSLARNRQKISRCRPCSDGPRGSRKGGAFDDVSGREDRRIPLRARRAVLRAAAAPEDAPGALAARRPQGAGVRRAGLGGAAAVQPDHGPGG